MATGGKSNFDLAEKLLKLLEARGMAASSTSLPIEVLLENRGIRADKNIPWEEVLDQIANKDAAARKVVSAYERYGKTMAKINKMLGEASGIPSTPGKGALSEDQVWAATGWKRTPEGGFVWSRPPNTKATEHFPPQVTQYVANYAHNPDAASAAYLAEQAGTLPVTAEDASEMRRVDAMYKRVDDARRKISVEDFMKQQAAKENLAKLDMDDMQLFIHEHREEYGGEKGAEQAYRKLLLKQLPPFFKDSKLSTKSLIEIRKAMVYAKGIPLVGRLMHPAALGFAALGLASSYLSASDSANKVVTKWSTSKNITGTPPKSFDAVARLAGAGNEQEVINMYGDLLAKYGSLDTMRSIGGALRSVPRGIARLKLLESRGLSAQQANALMYLAGESLPADTKDAQKTAKRLGELEDIRKYGLRTGSSASEKVRAWALSIPGEKSLEARGMSWLDIINLSSPAQWPTLLMNKTWSPSNDAIEKIDKGMKRQIEAEREAERSAESYDDYSSNGGDISNYNSSSNHAVYINEVNVASNNPERFVDGLESISDRWSGNNRAILASIGTGMLA